MKLKIILLLLLFFELCFAQNVIVVVVDGARYTETFGAEATYIPHMYNDLKPIGAVYTNFRIADAGITSTNPGHTSILTGTWQLIANDGTQRPTKPTVFEYFRKELGSSITENYVIAGKSKLDVISYSIDPAYGFNYRASESCSTLTDNQVYNNLVTIMDTYHPRLMIVNLPDTDLRGHAGDWNGYLSAITNADNLVYQLWQKIQADVFYQNNTTLFVTNDHGRHTTDYKSHGDDCEGCEHIMLLAIGRNVTPGVESSDLHHQIDIAPTIGDLLGFSTPQAVGVSLYQGSNPLPAELSSFSAIVLESAVKLNWRTETEVSNYGFEVERLQDYNIEKFQDWRKIGFVEGHGNSNSPKDYSLIDQNVSGGKYSYRLKQIDTDGQFEYSKVIEVDLGSPSKLELSQNYPNPFNPTTTIKYSLPQPGNVKLTVYNLLGEQVSELVNGFMEAGVHTINFNASELNSGIYIYKIEANGFVQSRKMTLIK
jgi:Secretion system C-terminal sorting domain/Metalloenzyme superfamily